MVIFKDSLISNLSEPRSCSKGTTVGKWAEHKQWVKECFIYLLDYTDKTRQKINKTQTFPVCLNLQGKIEKYSLHMPFLVTAYGWINLAVLLLLCSPVSLSFLKSFLKLLSTCKSPPHSPVIKLASTNLRGCVISWSGLQPCCAQWIPVMRGCDFSADFSKHYGFQPHCEVS